MNDLADRYAIFSSPDDRNHVVYRRRFARMGATEERREAVPRLMILGDDSEVDGRPPRPMGNAAAIQCNVEEGQIEVLTSIPGLPAIYLTETPAAVVLASDLFLLTCVDGLSLRFDPAGVTDLALIGRTVEHRTLFAGVQIIPGGRRLTLQAGRSPTIETAWPPPGRDPLANWDEYTALQIDAFDRSIRRLSLKDCAFSLSGGVDSRTTLAGLIASGAMVRALTVSGETPSLDARTASRLCAAYGLQHQIILLDDTFRRSLPELVSCASLLSGGLASVSHAAQGYCYQVLGSPPPVGMLSGYLGNQVGRRATEGLTPPNAGIAVLNDELIDESRNLAPPWYACAMQADGFLEMQFLVQHEAAFGGLASSAIGNTYSIQQSAYASRSVIENVWRMPTNGANARRDSRVKTLEHLFLGEPVHESFQRRYINRIGGLLATYPVNWGWRSRGGISFSGVAWGVLAMLDAIVSNRYPQSGARILLKKVGGAGLHEFQTLRDWMYRDMKDFVHDEIFSRKVKVAGLFDLPALERSLIGFYSDGRRGLGDAVMALDLALAARHVGATA